MPECSQLSLSGRLAQVALGVDAPAGSELRALGLHRLRAGTVLLDQRRHDAFDGPVREVPAAGELEHRQAAALRYRAHALHSLTTGLDPAGGSERAVVALAEAV